MSRAVITESNLTDIGDAIRAKLGVQTTYTPGQMAAAIGSIPTGSSVTVEALSVTENGTYTAPSGKAYSPVTVNVEGSGGDTYAFIVVSYAPGATCTATNGTTTLTAPDTSGTAVFAIPTPASTPETWTITQTLAGATSSTTVSVSQYGASYAVNVPGILPAEYTRVEYLEVGSTAGPYIVTPLYPGDLNSFEIVFRYTDTAAQANNNGVFGSGGSYRESEVQYYNGIDLNWGGGNAKVAFDTSTHKFELKNGSLYWDDESKFSAGSNFSTTQIFLFGFSYGSLTQKYLGKYIQISSFKAATDDGDYEFIPCYRNADNVPGMYDVENAVFYTNDGTGSFVVGPDA